MKLCLVCSSGGHFLELFNLKDFWQGRSHFWVSFPTQDTQSLLKKEKVYWANHPTNRNIKNFFKNMIIAWQVLKSERPDVVISTGAGVAVPFIIIGRLMGIKTIYIETMTRIKELSLSGYLIYPFVDKFLVQWPELKQLYKKSRISW